MKLVKYFIICGLMCPGLASAQKGAAGLLPSNSSSDSSTKKEKKVKEPKAETKTADTNSSKDQNEGDAISAKITAQSEATRKAADNLTEAEKKMNDAKRNIDSADAKVKKAYSTYNTEKVNTLEASKRRNNEDENLKKAVDNGYEIDCDQIECRNEAIRNEREAKRNLKEAYRELESARKNEDDSRDAYRKAKAALRQADKENTRNTKEYNDLVKAFNRFEERAELEARKSNLQDDYYEYLKKYGKVEKAYNAMIDTFDRKKIAVYIREKIMATMNSQAFCDAKANCDKTPRGKAVDMEKMKEIFPNTPGYSSGSGSSSSSSKGSN